MKKDLDGLKKELKSLADREKAGLLQGFFKTGKGEYGEGDVFLGVTVPKQRGVAGKYWRLLDLNDLDSLIASRFHEQRMTALLILIRKFEKGAEDERKRIHNFYLGRLKYVNSWDLVDLSAPRIVGSWLDGRDKGKLRELAVSKNVWKRRVAILSTFYGIRKGDPEPALEIASMLRDDPHDLIQKAVGWMLREIGKNCGEAAEEEFLGKHCRQMPRTMLRYAIEKFDPEKRAFYLDRAPNNP